MWNNLFEYIVKIFFQLHYTIILITFIFIVQKKKKEEQKKEEHRSIRETTLKMTNDSNEAKNKSYVKSVRQLIRDNIKSHITKCALYIRKFLTVLKVPIQCKKWRKLSLEMVVMRRFQRGRRWNITGFCETNERHSWRIRGSLLWEINKDKVLRDNTCTYICIYQGFTSDFFSLFFRNNFKKCIEF